jgi:hypothetical protein
MQDSIGFQSFLTNLFALYPNQTYFQEQVLHLLALHLAQENKYKQAIDVVTDQ